MYTSDKLFSYDNLFPNEQLKLPVGKIFQVSELSIISGGEIEAHIQQCDEITFAVEGEATFFSGTASQVVKAGEVHYIKKDILHKIVASNNENFRFICIGFIPDYDNFSVSAFYNAAASRAFFTLRDNGTIKNLSEFLIREFYNYDEFSTKMINGYLEEILITLARLICGKALDFKNNNCEKTANFAIYKALRFIDREYMNIKNVKEVATKLSYSDYYLSHLFREKLGITLKEYLTKKKITYACELLSATSLSVEEISERLCFSSSHSFRRAFKQQISVSPSEFKKTT